MDEPEMPVAINTEKPKMVDLGGPRESDTIAPADALGQVTGGQVGEEELISKFKSQELKYQDCPTHPKQTRRYGIFKCIDL